MRNLWRGGTRRIELLCSNTRHVNVFVCRHGMRTTATQLLYTVCGLLPFVYRSNHHPNNCFPLSSHSAFIKDYTLEATKKLYKTQTDERPLNTSMMLAARACSTPTDPAGTVICTKTPDCFLNLSSPPLLHLLASSSLLPLPPLPLQLPPPPPVSPSGMTEAVHGVFG